MSGKRGVRPPVRDLRKRLFLRREESWPHRRPYRFGAACAGASAAIVAAAASLLAAGGARRRAANMLGELHQEVGGCLRRTAGVCLRCGEPAAENGGGGRGDPLPAASAFQPAPPAPPPSPEAADHQPQVLRAADFDVVPL